jgi:hypothetical protein
MTSTHAFPPPPLANAGLSTAGPSNGHHEQQQLQQQEGGGVPLSRILEAHATIGPLIHRTPVLRCEAIDARMACRESARGPRRVFFKVTWLSSFGSLWRACEMLAWGADRFGGWGPTIVRP